MVQLPSLQARCWTQSLSNYPHFTATPPRLAVSPLGDSVVTMGAVRSALDFVEKETLDIELHHS